MEYKQSINQQNIINNPLCTNEIKFQMTSCTLNDSLYERKFN